MEVLVVGANGSTGLVWFMSGVGSNMDKEVAKGSDFVSV